MEQVLQIENKGTGAGGSNTNLYGKKFEEITDNEPLLKEQGYKHSITFNTIYEKIIYQAKLLILIIMDGVSYKTVNQTGTKTVLWSYAFTDSMR